jgi:outer membrane protein
MMNRLIVLTAFLYFTVLEGTAQIPEPWDLRRCVEYALANNISVKQADLQIRFAELDRQQSKLAQYPGVHFSSNLGYSSGRNQDPTSFSLITTGYLFNSYSLQTSVDLFNWFTKKNSIAEKDLNVQAAEASVSKVKDDIALNVAVAYLQILLAKEQVTLSKIQAEQTSLQLQRTRKLVDAGTLPALNAAQLEAQLANDSANLITAETTVRQMILQMKALLNLDPAAAFDVVTPPVDRIPVESLADLQPEAVYNLALVNLPQQKVDELRLKSARKTVEVARGNMYPTFSLFGSLGTTFNNRAREITGKSQVTIPVGTVNVNGTDYTVFPLQPFDVYSFGKIPYFDQLNQNFRQSIGLSVSVPIFNNGVLRTNWQRSKLNVRQVELQKEQNSFSLKQDIYKAYNDALAALQKFNAGKKAVETAEIAYRFAQKRYDLNLLATYELITAQTNLLQAKTQLLYSQYDYVFKMKLLEFYKGQGIKL